MNVPNNTDDLVDKYLIGLFTKRELAHELAVLFLPYTQIKTLGELDSFLHEHFTMALHGKVDNAWDEARELIGILARDWAQKE